MSPKSNGRPKPKQRRHSQGHLRPVESVPIGPWDEVLAHGNEPDWADDPLQAEILATAVLNTLERDAVPPLTSAQLAANLLAKLTEQASPEAIALLAGLAVLAEPPLAKDADAALIGLQQGGAAMPRWLDDLSHPVPGDVTVLRDQAGNGTQLVCLFRYPNQAEHAVVVFVDNRAGLARSAWVDPDGAAMLKALRAMAHADRGSRLGTGDRAAVRALVETAMARTVQTADQDVDEDLYSNRALIAARMALLSPGGASPDHASLVKSSEQQDAVDGARRSFANATRPSASFDADDFDADDEDAWMEIAMREHPEYSGRFDEELIDGVNPRLHIALHSAVAQQLWSNEPPEVWATARRLTTLGYDRHQVLHALSFALGEMIRQGAVNQTRYNPRTYAALLDQLPDSWESVRPVTQVFQLKVTLRGIRPPVWRRLEVPVDETLGGLHDILQTAMGWTDSHLHMFEAAGARFGPLDPDDELDLLDEAAVPIEEMAEVGSTFQYVYDFGDYWEHDITVEKVLEARAADYPRCTGGRRACPPEDVGGTGGYAEYLAAIGDPDHPRHRELLDWGGDFDPAAFDRAAVDRALREW